MIMENQQTVIRTLLERYPVLEVCSASLESLIDTTVASYRQGGTFFVAGNGGSGADADHICGELLKGFRSRRALSDAETTHFQHLHQKATRQ